MITLLLYIIIAALPVLAFKCNRRWNCPLEGVFVCLITLVAAGLLLWGTAVVFQSEFHTALTDIYEREQTSNSLEFGNEFDASGKASRAISSCNVAFAAILSLWYLIVCGVELASGASSVRREALLSVLCTNCNHEEFIDAELAGLKGSCPNCGTVLTFPLNETDAVPLTPTAV